MKIKILGGLLMAAMAVTSVANAQTRTPEINHRQHNQERRINQGVRSGELTRNETHRLRKDERKIRAEKRTAMDEGRMTRHERRHIRRQQDRLSRKIYRDKHNNSVR